ncbi:MAG: hypothetical protein HY673_25345 [Chloroflexi bacterium]|nr:hypothetical protein [Chloroflexota bacterium]
MSGYRSPPKKKLNGLPMVPGMKTANTIPAPDGGDSIPTPVVENPVLPTQAATVLLSDRAFWDEW